MSNLYTKNKEGKYIPVSIKSYLGKEMEGHIVVVRVGTDEYPSSSSDLDTTEDSFSQADVLNELRNVSIIITPYQIDVGKVSKEEEKDKHIYLQISSWSDIGMLEEQIKKIFKKIKKKFSTVVLPTPLKIRDYRKIKDILKRSQIRRERRGRARG